MSIYLVTKDPITKETRRVLCQVEDKVAPIAVVEIKKKVIAKKQKPLIKKEMFTEKKFICSQCKSEFTWTIGEQKFMHKLYEQGTIDTVKEPKRCPECRQKKKARYDN